MRPLHLNALALRASSCQSAAAFNPSSEFFSLFDPPPFFCFCFLVSFIHRWTPPFKPVRDPTPHRPLSVNRCRTYWQIPGSEALGCSPKWTVLCAALILCFLIPASGMIPQRLSALIFNNVRRGAPSAISHRSWSGKVRGRRPPNLFLFNRDWQGPPSQSGKCSFLGFFSFSSEISLHMNQLSDFAALGWIER